MYCLVNSYVTIIASGSYKGEILLRFKILHTDIVQPAIEHLQAEYKETRYVSSKDDWPPDQPKHFTSVALIQYKEKSSKQDNENVYTLTREGIKSFINFKPANDSYASVSFTKTSKQTKDVAEIFKPVESSVYTIPKTILIEGTPGIGKTVLCKEIAYQWATKQLLVDKSLLFLLMLRNPGVQKLKSLLELAEYCCRNRSASKALEQYLYNTRGSDLVIILDGYDEISEAVRQRSLIADIIDRNVLPERTLVISSRPLCTAQLHNNMDCRVEILGFTNSDRQKFIQESLWDTPEKVPVLQKYLNENSIISTFCYIPLIMTILLCLFKASIKLPETQTELYQKFICHTIVHFLKKSGSFTYPIKSVTSLSNLAQPYRDTIEKLAKVSFTLLAEDKIVFTADDIRRICPSLNIGSKGCMELGLLRVTQHFDIEEIDPVVSYNFLHLSIQEYLAAWHISSVSFLQQKEILQRTFWSPRYFNAWIIYMGLTKGKTNAFQYFLGGSFTNFVYNRYARNFVISNRILVEKVKCLHLFQCFMEAKNDNMCTIVGSFFEDLIIDLGNQTLLPKDVNILCFYLLRSKNSEWHKLDLSGCNIGDMGCSIMHKSLIVDNNIFLQVLDLSGNHLTSNSAAAIIDLVQSFKVVELNISNNPLQNLPLELLYKCKHLKSLITGNEKYSDDRGTKPTIKNIIDQSSLQFVSIKDSNGSSLIFNKGDFKIMSFSSSYSSIYCNFIMKNCKITKITSKDLAEFLISQSTLKYFCICYNNFDESAILSISSTLIETSYLQEIVISENSLTSITIDKIIAMFTSFADCSVMVYSQYELQAVNVLSTQIIELLAEQPDLIRLKIINCKQANGDLLNIKNVPNAIEVFNFYTNRPGSIACFAKAFNYALLKKICINKAIITDDAVNDIVKTLSYNATLTEFDLSHSTLSTKAANRIIGTLANMLTLETFSICNCGISDEVANNIAVVLKNNCTTLTTVDFSNNKLNSNASVEIFRALKSSHNLKKFKINGNKISDEVAENITNILYNNPHLVEVDVTLNQFTPMIGRNIVTALKNNTSLKIFNIGNCRVTEEVANEVASIITNNPGLVEVDLSGSHLTSVGTHKIVQALAHTKNLRIFKANKHMITKSTANKVTNMLSHNSELVYLDVSSSLFTFRATKLIRSLQNKPLQVLKMSNSKITKAVAHEIGDILKTAPLIELDLSDNPALTTIGATLVSTELKTLQILNLRNCGITENTSNDFTLALSTLTNLRELDISYNQFTSDSIFRFFEGLNNTQIQVLKLNGCKTIWNKKEQRDFFPNKTKIFHLELSGTSFPISSILKYTSGLQIIDISRCLYVNDEEAKRLSDGISSNPSLKKLDISYNDLTTGGAIQIVRALQNFRTLQSFAINNCKIRDNASRFIAAAISLNLQLVELNISWNALTGIGAISIIQSLKKISHLQVLKAAGCGLTEKEAEELANMLSDKTSLKELDLSWNELKAEGISVVIKALCTVVSLKVLKIDNCNITDKAAHVIATNIAKHYALMELDISHNDFTPAGVGIVVKSLKVLSNLTVLKISNCILDEGSSTEIAGAISNNCSLSHFELYHSHFTTTGATLFCQEISNRIHILQTLKLVNCSITDKESHEIATILTCNETIEHLDLSHNPLGEGVTEITRVLQTNKIIEELILQSCAITDKVASDIASIARSTTLREFNILHNQLTNNGAFIIAKGFMDSTSLKILKIKDWSEISQHENYVLLTLQGNNVSLNLE